MKHLIFALKTEALSLINAYQLKKIKHLPFTLYVNKDISVLITQMGYNSAHTQSELYFEYIHFNKNDILINIGICAADQSHNISDILFINRVSNHKNMINLTPIKYKEYKTSSLITHTDPQSKPHSGCADMEAFAIIDNAQKYLPKENIFVIKIVSDHYEPDSITKESVIEMMQNKNSALQEIIEEIQCQQQ